MRRILFVTFCIFASLALIGCNSAAPPVAVNAPSNSGVAKTAPIDDHADEDDAPRISLADAKKDFDSGAALFIDTHPKSQYDAGHIPGAINIQANTIKFEINKIPKGKKIIAYCS